MTKDEFLTKAAAGEAVLVDIREDAELAASPSPAGALHVPLSKLAEHVHKLPTDKLVVTICQSGGRCVPVTQLLNVNGFTADYIEGGLSNW